MAFPKFEDWQPAWEKAGEDFDEDAARKRIYDLEKDKHTRGEKLSERDAEIKTLKDENAELVKTAATSKREGETETQRLERELADAKTKLDEAAASTRANDLLKVRLETGLSEKQVSRLTGDDFDALLADAKEYAEENGIALKGDEPADDEPGGDEPSPRRTPVRVRNNLDPKPDDGVFDIQKAIDAIPR
jgi:hypothetical protein